MEIQPVIDSLTEFGLALVPMGGSVLLVILAIKAHQWVRSALGGDDPRSRFPELYD